MSGRAAQWVTVLIVNWNTAQLLRNCLTSLYSIAEAEELEIIVVDNGSEDGSLAIVETQFPAVKTIRNVANEGFARAVNQGFREATAPHVLLLNSDTEVRSGAIAYCRRYLQTNPAVGVVGCRIENPDGSTQNSIFRYPSFRGVVSTAFWLAQARPHSAALNHDRYGLAQPDEVTAVDVVMGSFLMLRRSDHDADLLDDGFFMYGEEADLCRRLDQRGLAVHFVPEVTVMHVRGASSRTPRQGAWSDEAKKRSVLRFLRKWNGTPTAYVANLVMIVGLLPRAVGWVAADGASSLLRRPAGRIFKIRALPFHLAAVVRPSAMDRRFSAPPVDVFQQGRRTTTSVTPAHELTND